MDAAGTRAYYATIAPYYDTELAARDDLRCWLSLAEDRKPRQIVDCGCGTGRVAVPLAVRCAEWGGAVVGVDLSPAMLHHARQHWRERKTDAPASALQLRVGDMRRMALGHAVDLAIFANDPLTHLASWHDLTATFRGLREHLRPGGRLVVEASLLPPEAMGKPAPVVIRSQFSARAPNGVIQVEQERRIEAARRRADVTYRYHRPVGGRSESEAVTEARFIAHYLDVASLEALFRLAGCRLEERWGDFRFQALTNESPMMLCTGRKL
jgi:SAM-dependent methyltransferase